MCSKSFCLANSRLDRPFASRIFFQSSLTTHVVGRECIGLKTWYGGLVRFSGRLCWIKCTRQESNLQPSVPKTDALSN